MKKIFSVVLVLLFTFYVRSQKTATFNGKEYLVYPYGIHLDIADADLIDGITNYSNFCALPNYPAPLKDGNYIAYYMQTVEDTTLKKPLRVAATFSLKKNKKVGACSLFYYKRDSVNASKVYPFATGQYLNNEKTGTWKFIIYSDNGNAIGKASVDFKNDLCNGKYNARIGSRYINCTYLNNKLNGAYFSNSKRRNYRDGDLYGLQIDTGAFFYIKTFYLNGDKSKIEVFNKVTNIKKYTFSNIRRTGNFHSQNGRSAFWEPALLPEMNPPEYEYSRVKFSIGLEGYNYDCMIHDLNKKIVVADSTHNLLYLNYSLQQDYRDTLGKLQTYQFKIVTEKSTELPDHYTIKLYYNQILSEVFLIPDENVNEEVFISKHTEYNELKSKIWASVVRNEYEGYRFYPAWYDYEQYPILYHVNYSLYYYQIKNKFIPNPFISDTFIYNKKNGLDTLVKQHFKIENTERFDCIVKNSLPNKGSNESFRAYEIKKGICYINDALYLDSVNSLYQQTSENLSTNIPNYDLYNGEFENSRLYLPNGDCYYPVGYQNIYALRSDLYTERKLFFNNVPYTGTIYFIDSFLPFSILTNEKVKLRILNNELRVIYYYPDFDTVVSRNARQLTSIIRIDVENGSQTGLNYNLNNIGKDSFVLHKYIQYKVFPDLKYANQINIDGRNVLSIYNASNNKNFIGEKLISKNENYLLLNSSQLKHLTNVSNKVVEFLKEQEKNSTVIAREKKGYYDGPAFIVNNGGQIITNFTDQKISDSFIFIGYNKKVKMYWDKNQNGKIVEYHKDKSNQWYVYSKLEFTQGKIQLPIKTYYNTGIVEQEIMIDTNMYIQFENNPGQLEINLHKLSNRLFFYQHFIKENINTSTKMNQYYNNSYGIFDNIKKCNLNLKQYNPNGVLMAIGPFLDGKRVGRWKFYTEKKNLFKTIHYDNERKTTNHSYTFHDTIMGYNSKGELNFIGSNNNDNTDSDCELNFTMPLNTVNYEKLFGKQKIQGKDTLVYIEDYRYNGNLYCEGWCNKATLKKEGVWKYYDKNAQLNAIGKYINGEKDGRWISGNLTGIKYLEDVCFNPEDSLHIFEHLNHLNFTNEIFNKGEVLKTEYIEVSKNNIYNETMAPVLIQSYFLPYLKKDTYSQSHAGVVLQYMGCGGRYY